MFKPGYSEILDERQAALRAQLNSILPTQGGTFVWEIGCGHGHFLTAYAAAHPERLCIGIDLVSERIERASRKRDRAKLTNLHFVRAEARLFVATLPTEARADAIYLLFPDPWPKLRHNKHRILQPEFLTAAAAHAVPQCPLYFRTDFLPYFEAGRQVLAADFYWGLTDEPWAFEHRTVFQERAGVFHSLVARCKKQPELGAKQAISLADEPSGR